MTGNGLVLPPEMLLSMSRHAVYRCYSDGGELLYVGTSGHLGKRLASHAEKAWFLQVRGITLEWYADEVDALAAERRAIHVEHPRYNVQHRNGSTVKAKVRNGKSRRQRRAPSQAPEVTLAHARQILAAKPGISGSALGRELGMTDRYGRDLIKRLAGVAPSGRGG